MKVIEEQLFKIKSQSILLIITIKKQQLGNNTRTYKLYPHLNNDLIVFKLNLRVIITSSPTE